MKLLLAEDDLTSRLILQTLLTQWGYETLTVEDGNEAWELLQSPDAPALCILDWMMPGMDGLEICRKLRQMDPMNPAYIILLTSVEGKKNIVSGLDAGANDYVTKPFDNDELRARIAVGMRVVTLQFTLAKQKQELKEALAQLNVLQGILPICMHCKKIRDDQGYWNQLESYISSHSHADFSHSLCPECAKTYYPDLFHEGNPFEQKPLK